MAGGEREGPDELSLRLIGCLAIPCWQSECLTGLGLIIADGYSNIESRYFLILRFGSSVG